MLEIAYLVLILACATYCYFAAKKRGSNAVFWVVMGALLGPVAILLMLYLHQKERNNFHV